MSLMRRATRNVDLEAARTPRPPTKSARRSLRPIGISVSLVISVISFTPSLAGASDIAPAVVGTNSLGGTLAWNQYGTIYFDSIRDGSSTWYTPQVVVHKATSNPSQLSTATTNYVFASVGGTLEEFSQRFGTSGWATTVIGCCDYSHGAAVTVAGSSLVAVARGNDDSLNYFQLAAGAATWTHVQVTGSDAMVRQPTVTWSGSTVLIAYTTGHEVAFIWHPLGGAFNSEAVSAGFSGFPGMAGSPTIAWENTQAFGENLEYASIVVTGTDGSLNVFSQAAGSPSWTFQQVEGPHSVLGNPSLTEPPDFDHIVYTGFDGSLDYLYFDPQNLFEYWVGLGWTSQTIVPGGSPTGVTVDPTIVWTGTALFVAVGTYLGNLDFWWQAAGHMQWTPENPPTV